MSKEVPSYRRHKKSGQAIVTLTQGGVRKDVLLGKYGTKASKLEYARVLAEWEARGRSLPAGDDLTMAELMTRFLAEAVKAYPARTIQNIKDAYRPLNYLYGSTQAKDFGAMALKSVRELMTSTAPPPRPIC